MSNSLRASAVAAHPQFQARVRALVLRKVSNAVAHDEPNKAQLVEAYRRVTASPKNIEYAYISFAMVPEIAAKVTEGNGGEELTDEDLQAVIDEYFIGFSEMFA